MHPTQQHGRRIPLFILDIPFLMRMPLVSAFAPEVTQQIHSLRANGVMSSQSDFTFALEEIASRKSSGSLCTVPPASATDMDSIYQILDDA